MKLLLFISFLLFHCVCGGGCSEVLVHLPTELHGNPASNLVTELDNLRIIIFLV
jgi:hypothetical protein